MCGEYERKGLKAHPSKTFKDEPVVEFWGASIDGQTGLVRPSPKRLVPLLSLTAQVARLGFATCGLLEVLAGSWVSVCQYRRRTMSLLDAIYCAQRGRDQEDLIQLSRELIDELWLLVVIGPVICTDMRAQSVDKVFLSDASEGAQAVVQSSVPKEFARELQRHCLTKGSWSKLLSPWKLWLKSHGKLSEAEELPSGVPLVSHPLWLQLAQSLCYEPMLFSRVRKGRHINILELDVVMKLEKELASQGGDLRYLLGADSQVALSCLVKGRSSSPHLNVMLQRSLPHLLGGGLYGNYGYVPSLANVADDPTRDVPIRDPVQGVPEWLWEALNGQFESMDHWLQGLGFDPLRVAELPFADEEAVSEKRLREELLPKLREVQKPDRLALFDQTEKMRLANDQSSSAREHLFCTEETFSTSLPVPKPCTETELVARSHLVQSTNCTAQNMEDSLVAARKDSSLVSAARSGSVSPPVSTKEELKQNGAKEPEGQTKSSDKRPKRSKRKKALQKTSRCCFTGGAPSLRKEGRRGVTCPSGHPGRDKTGAIAMASSCGAENPLAPILSGEAAAALALFARAQFFMPGGKRAPPDFVPKRKGVLDLYSGASGVAKHIAKKHRVWVLTVDYDHGPCQDLLSQELQDQLLSAIAAGCFLGLGAAPDCSSFSRAITPAVRSAEWPFGKPHISQNMAVKVAIGNQHAAFMLRVLQLCDELGIPYWCENPDGSFLWLLPGWMKAGIGTCSSSYRFDQCIYSTPWRKRTRVATSTALRGLRLLCRGGHSHLVLRGRSSKRNLCWTKVAQVYPWQLCRDLGDALADSAGLCPGRRRLDVAGCCRSGHLRCGEASHPGPAPSQYTGPRDPGQLQDVRLVEPSTAKRQDKLLGELQTWLADRLSASTIPQLYLCPELAVNVVRTYALHLFSSGRKLYELRYTLIALQHEFPHWKPYMAPLWALVSKWEMLQPLQHRMPLPELLFKALFVLGALKRWTRWVGVLLLGYEGIARIGEVLAATRADLLLPSDLCETDAPFVFVRVRSPKTRYRGRGRVQHLKVKTPAAVAFLEQAFSHLDPTLQLFPHSAVVFRRKWDHLLDLLQVPKLLRPTPASVRGGGAILAYRRGEPISDILWRMRLSSQQTLSAYLQELAADSVVSRMPPRVRARILHVASLYPTVLQSLG
eukprot:Skav205711  [mRNA]  locus=scaffold608:39645:43142:- [translate_table: standard]